jgi:hypothetical protein
MRSYLIAFPIYCLGDETVLRNNGYLPTDDCPLRPKLRRVENIEDNKMESYDYESLHIHFACNIMESK